MNGGALLHGPAASQPPPPPPPPRFGVRQLTCDPPAHCPPKPATWNPEPGSWDPKLEPRNPTRDLIAACIYDNQSVVASFRPI